MSVKLFLPLFLIAWWHQSDIYRSDFLHCPILGSLVIVLSHKMADNLEKFDADSDADNLEKFDADKNFEWPIQILGCLLVILELYY